MMHSAEFVAVISVIVSWLSVFQKVNSELVSNRLMDVQEGCEPVSLEDIFC